MGKEYVKLLLLLLVLLHHGDSASIIRSLPGFEGPLPFELETGYIGVGEEEEIQLFYYFIKSESNPEEDPLLLWLSGGPGCSSLGAFLVENGPLTLKMNAYNGSTPSLVSTTYSWTKVANMIYIDQPVGSGYSYSTTPFVDIPSDTGEAKRVHEFVQKWLSKHPDFFSNPFYVTGNSYAGKVVPAIVQEISRGNYICCKPQINLQGYVLGDPETNNDYESYWIPFAHGMALISDEMYQSLKRSCGGNYKDVDPRNVECLKLIEDFHKLIAAINTESILTPSCDETSPDCYKYRNALCSYWANDNSVHNALQVDKESTKSKWERCYRDIPYKQDIISSVPYHKYNSINGYRSLIFNGDHDLEMPFLGTQAWIRSLNYSVVDDWRPWMINNQVAGYTRTYANKMTFATIKGGGHTIEYKPIESFVMFQRWISGQIL